MRYEDFVVGRRYEVLKNLTDIDLGFDQDDFSPGEIVEFKGSLEAIHESYTILKFGGPKSLERRVKFGIGLPEPDWSLYFRAVK